MKKIIKLGVVVFLAAAINGCAKQYKLESFTKGTENIIDYEKYGEFSGIGTDKYRYRITDRAGLSEAAGLGIYPNTSVFRSKEYLELKKAGKLEGNHWNYIDTPDAKLNFYKWATAQEHQGVKQFYVAVMLEKMGFLEEALKAYYNVVIHFPAAHSFTYWLSPWYIGPTSIDKIHFITRTNPQLGLKLIDAEITMYNTFDASTANDRFIVNPGKLIRVKPSEVIDKKIDLSKQKIVERRGSEKVQLVKYANGHWQLLVHGKPFMVKGMVYQPNKVGLSPDRGTLNATRDWQVADFNNNGLIDGPYEAWVDANFNNKQDKNEPTVGDFQLMKEMGCNTIRIYDHVINKELIRDLYDTYGIMAAVGDLIGGYAVGSGASWEEGTDYENPAHQKNMLEHVRKMVLENKDEPYTLMWILGNENIYGVGNNSNKKPEAFFKFLNKAAKLIRELDQTHPIATSSGDLGFLDIIAKNCPDIDIFGTNVYRGNHGFGTSFFSTAKNMMGLPVLITEYGCSAFAEGYTEKEALRFQKEYFVNNWLDIEYNSAGSGIGNAIGGFAFEWVDEWWKANSNLPVRIQKQRKEWYEERKHIYENLQPDVQDAVPQFGAPFLDGWSYEEWYGIFSQGDGKSSPFLRQKRPVYDGLKEVWTK